MSRRHLAGYSVMVPALIGVTMTANKAVVGGAAEIAASGRDASAGDRRHFDKMEPF